ncbi:hypothetical protein IWX90DRAFT_515673 [Phyllosticta citrichinensis]|uniref:Uncharacterized protein n=1 Tax=Phyllosticta citrichinensis TaxID=1130410 RepID=A0ABR1XPC6_9PEZI
MASLFKGLSKAIWGVFSTSDSREATKQQGTKLNDGEPIPQTSRKRPLDDETEDDLEPNKRAILHRLGGSRRAQPGLEDGPYQDDSEDPNFDDGQFDDAEALSDQPYIKSEEYDDDEPDEEPFIKLEEVGDEYEYFDEPQPSSAEVPANQFSTPERQYLSRADDGGMRDRLQSTVQKKLWLQKEREQRERDAEKLRSQGLSEDTVQIHKRIGMRGMIPCFPSTWAYTLNTLDRVHFTSSPSEAFVKSLYDNDFRAVKAFQRLMSLGAWARDAVTNEEHTSPNRKPEKLIRREIGSYIKWAFKDGQVYGSDYVPTIGVYSAPLGADLDEFQNRVTLDLFVMKQAWRLKLREESEFQGRDLDSMFPAPDVYGIAIVDTEVRFVVLDDVEDQESGQLREEPFVRIFSQLDFARPDYDFWNAQAVALLVVHCRNNMVELEEIIREGPNAEGDVEASSIF